MESTRNRQMLRLLESDGPLRSEDSTVVPKLGLRYTMDTRPFRQPAQRRHKRSDRRALSRLQKTSGVSPLRPLPSPRHSALLRVDFNVGALDNNRSNSVGLGLQL